MTEPKKKFDPLVVLPDDFICFINNFAVLADHLLYTRMQNLDESERMAYQTTREYWQIKSLTTVSQLAQSPGWNYFIGCLTPADFYEKFWDRIRSVKRTSEPLIEEMEARIEQFKREVTEMKREGFDRRKMLASMLSQIGKKI